MKDNTELLLRVGEIRGTSDALLNTCASGGGSPGKGLGDVKPDKNTFSFLSDI